MRVPGFERNEGRLLPLRAPFAAVALVLACAGTIPAFSSDDSDRDDSPAVGAARVERPLPLSAAERERAGALAARIELEWPLRGADEASAFVRKLGQRLADAAGPVASRWQFTLVRDRSINAFAIGNGHVYLSDGAIARCDDEAELAALMAHEMGHQLAGHFGPGSGESVWRALLARMTPGTGREVDIGSIKQSIDPTKEREADEHSLRILRAAHYDPQAALRLARRVLGEHSGRPQHLDDARRIDALAALLEGVGSEGKTDSPEFASLHRRLADDLGIAPHPAASPPARSESATGGRD